MSQKKGAVLVVAAVIRRSSDPEKRILVVRRGPDQSGAGFWEFPGGKVEPGESSEGALIREIQEELSIAITVGELIGESEYQYPTKNIRLAVYWAMADHCEIKLSDHDAMTWSLPEEIEINELSEADRPFVTKIIQGSK